MSEMDERSKKILWAIIQDYVSCEGPVGSRTVMKKYPMGLSSSTIRNTMADLEDMGYVIQPHTSAGRIPTDRGYRLYVNTLLKECAFSINKKLLDQLSDRLQFLERDINNLIKETSQTLSQFSHYLGFVTAPKTEEMILRHIDFILHKGHKILCILVSEEGVIKNRFITIKDNTFTQRELDKITAYLNSRLKGLALKEIRAKILSQMAQERTTCDKLIHDALTLCKRTIDLETENAVSMGEISGTCNLPDFATMEQIRNLFRAIEEKHTMMKLLDKIMDSEGVQVFIGSENALAGMDGLSVVASTYKDGDRTLGTISVIGPTRMNYDRVIPIVSYTAKTLTKILSEN
ncbi:MAG: heat-inducible transcription repressor HrcA [Nitrospirae bacterium]|nr:heat-inducible transcription repressor HrcA [Nitrospirota bacterium]